MIRHFASGHQETVATTKFHGNGGEPCVPLGGWHITHSTVCFSTTLHCSSDITCYILQACKNDAANPDFCHEETNEFHATNHLQGICLDGEIIYA